MITLGMYITISTLTSSKHLSNHLINLRGDRPHGRLPHILRFSFIGIGFVVVYFVGVSYYATLHHWTDILMHIRLYKIISTWRKSNKKLKFCEKTFKCFRNKFAVLHAIFAADTLTEFISHRKDHKHLPILQNFA